jgi:ribosomal protein S18 acetylase RimI-like enzyme
MVGELKHLWQSCFDDEAAYMDLYFDRYYAPEQTLVHAVDGRAVSMMTLLPATLVGNGRTHRARYLYAVGTLPAYRQQGLSTQLAAQADARMRAEGCELALVVPASAPLFAFYARQGFTVAFYRRVVSFAASAIDVAGAVAGLALRDTDRWRALRERYFAPNDFFVRWDTRLLSYALDECLMSRGDLFYFAGGGAGGYVLTEPKGAEVVVKEAALPPALAPQALAFLKRQYTGATRFTFHLSPRSPLWRGRGRLEPVGMWKWLTLPPPAAASSYIGLLQD